ncbi:hypothetical protein JOM56_011498 [Amanita muscaria]
MCASLKTHADDAPFDVLQNRVQDFPSPVPVSSTFKHQPHHRVGYRLAGRRAKRWTSLIGTNISRIGIDGRQSKGCLKDKLLGPNESEIQAELTMIAQNVNADEAAVLAWRADNEEFKDLERDISLGGRVPADSTSQRRHQKYLSKKKLNEALDEAEKLLAIDALGVVMIVPGEEYHDDSVFGNSLVKLGRFHCKIATLQEAFASTVKTTFLSFLSRFDEEIKGYDAMRKKLESRRLSYNTALAKTEKSTNSKEKERREELERAHSLRIPSSVRTDPTASQDSSDEEEDSSLALSRRRNSSRLRKSETRSKPGSLPDSRPSSRAASRASRKRSDSAATVSERDKEVEKDKVEKPKRTSVASKDKDRFSALEDPSDDQTIPRRRSEEKWLVLRKTFKALQKEGDIIIIVNEVLDEWWLGSLNNQKGLFPSAFVEIILADSVDDYNDQLQSEMYGAGASDVDEDGDLSRNPCRYNQAPSITSSGSEDEESDLMSRKKTEGNVQVGESWPAIHTHTSLRYYS